MFVKKLAISLYLATIPAAAILLAYSSGPLPQRTGGFGEGTCVECHSTFKLNEGRTLGGVFEITGIPRTFQREQAYPITVILGQPGQSRWGFELSVRFAGSGLQAGRLTPDDANTQVKEAGGIQYIEHTTAGSRESTADGPVEFHFTWTAPDPSVGAVLFNAAGNAANNDGTPKGDYIYTAGGYSGVPGVTGAAAITAARRESRKVERLTESSRLMDLPNPVDLNKGSMEFLIQHRFFQTLRESGPGDALGVDSGANINLAFDYALTDRLSLGVSRARLNQIIAFSGSYEIRTRKDSFWKMSLNAGVEGTRNFEREFSPYLQLATAFDYKALRLHMVPTAVFNSRPDSQVREFPALAVNPDSNNTFSLGVGADVALDNRFSLIGEYVPRLAGFGGFGKSYPQFGGGVEIRTAAHVFTILASTSWDFTPATYAVNAGKGDISLGFNIYRRFR